MKTYNFIVGRNKTEESIEINARSEEEAITIVQNIFPKRQGWWYILM